jgi:hypothetical protein
LSNIKENMVKMVQMYQYSYLIFWKFPKAIYIIEGYLFVN